VAAGKGDSLFEELMRFKPEGLTANAWAVRAGISRNFWNDLKRHGNPSRRTLEKLLTVADSSLAEFEALRADGETSVMKGPGHSALGESGRDWRAAPLTPLPVIATAPAGEWHGPASGIEVVRFRRGEVIDRLPRPGSLAADPGAYAVTVIGDSMWPRYRPGRRIAVSPRSPVAIGDDVVVLLGSDLALIKELVRRTAASIELRQYNPDLTFRVEAADVVAVHKVLGELI
jgi:SOS-response transcriptional repressor LexA